MLLSSCSVYNKGYPKRMNGLDSLRASLPLSYEITCLSTYAPDAVHDGTAVAGRVPGKKSGAGG